jgi:peptidoglycan/LPS O-acetylase OafA/YrhL
MAAVVEMFGGMLVLRGIAATHVAAYHAQAQVNPFIAHFDALFTDARVGGRDLDLIEVLAFL